MRRNVLNRYLEIAETEGDPFDLYDRWTMHKNFILDLNTPEALLLHIRQIGLAAAMERMLASSFDEHSDFDYAQFDEYKLFSNEMSSLNNLSHSARELVGKINKPYTIRFGYDVVFSCTRKRKQLDLLNRLAHYGPDWRDDERKADGWAKLIEPFGYVVLSDGNHSSSISTIGHYGKAEISERIDFTELLKRSYVTIDGEKPKVQLLVEQNGQESRFEMDYELSLAWFAAQQLVIQGSEHWTLRDSMAKSAQLPPFN